MISTSISVVIGIYGNRAEWERRAQRALKSAVLQSSTYVDAKIVYADTLAQARNKGAEEARGAHLIFLDADDELDLNYVASMQAALDEHGPDHLFQPSTLGIRPDGVKDPAPVLIPQRDIRTGNFMVIGTMVPRELFLDVGGFQEFRAWEDWELFWRCMDAGATPVAVPEAIYRVHVSSNGRNASVEGDRLLLREIQKAHRAWQIERGFV